MQKLFPFTAILALVSFLSCSRKADQITHKWLVTETVISAQKLSGEMVSGFYLELKKDGKYTLSGMSTERGVWQLSQQQDSLVTTNDQGRRVAYLIQLLNSESLTLYDNSLGAEMVTSFRK